VPPISEWQTLLAVQAGAAATLTGLVFVAVSLNLAKIMAIAGLPGRAGESILQFLQVFFVATVALIPEQPVIVLAAEMLLIAAVSWTAQTVSQIRYAKSRAGHPWSWLITRVLFSQFATIPFCVAGIGLLLGLPGAFYWIVPGFVLSFVAGILSAWVLLIEILR
jgi:hypothetical protein